MYVFGSGQRGWRGGEWIRGLCLGFSNHVGVLDVCLYLGCGGVGGERVRVWTRVPCCDYD